MLLTKSGKIDRRTTLGKIDKELDEQIEKSTWISDYNLSKTWTE